MFHWGKSCSQCRYSYRPLSGRYLQDTYCNSYCPEGPPQSEIFLQYNPCRTVNLSGLSLFDISQRRTEGSSWKKFDLSQSDIFPHHTKSNLLPLAFHFQSGIFQFHTVRRRMPLILKFPSETSLAGTLCSYWNLMIQKVN